MHHRARLSQLRSRFIAANMRSRTLRLTRTTRSGALDLARLAQAWPKGFEALRKKLGKESSRNIPVIPVRPQDAEALALSEDLAMLLRAERADWVETGAQNLAVGWPILEGRALDGTWLRGPLLLFPLSFETTSVGLQRWVATLQGFPDLNVGLAQALFRLTRVRITLDAILDHDDDRILAIDEATWLSFWNCLRNLELPMSDGPPNLPPLTSLPTRDRQGRDRRPKGQFSLNHQMILGRFPRGGSNIILDYDGLLKSDDLGLAAELLAVDEDTSWEAGTPLEDRPEAPSRGTDPMGGGRRWQILPSDSSQDAVFRFLDQTGTQGLVVQGPPGTGKSQMITNLIASCVATGRRALLVCQKRAALDVVADRLESVGLREPIAVVHDASRDRNAVCDAIVETLDKVLTSGAGPASETLERALQSAERACDAAQNRLDARLKAAQQTYETLAAGTERPPLATLQERALDDDRRPLPDLVSVAAQATETQALTLRPRIAALAHDTTPLAVPHPLAQRTQWSEADDEGVEAIFSEVKATLAILEEMKRGAPHLDPEASGQHDEAWQQARDLLDLIESRDTDKVDAFLLFWIWTDGQAQHGEWAQVMGILRRARQTLRKVPYELVVASRAEVDGWIKDLARLRELSSRWYRFVMPEYWSLSKTPRIILERCNSLTADLQSGALVKIDDLCERALGWHDLIAALPGDNLALDFGFQGEPQEIDDAITDLRTQHDRVEALHDLHVALRAHGGPYAEIPDLDPLSNPARLPFFQAAIADRRRAHLLGRLDEALETMAARWAAPLLERLRDDARAGRLDRACSALEAILGARPDAAEATRLDRQMKADPWWMQHFLRLWRPPEGTFADASEDALLSLERAWRRLALQGRSTQALEAPLVDDAQLRGFGLDLDHCLDVAGQGVLARYHRGLASTASDKRRSRALRKLAGEARKKRRRMSLRQLVEHYWSSGLSQVRPVWFCSPESVAALFPLRSDLFDLVIFDEASQCPVESAVPTLARTHKAIIAGDDQQMPPSHFFRASDTDTADDDDEDSAVLASHSLLALARVAFPDTTLRWHYRSRHESLVAFSNTAFYGGRLITAPRREPITAPLIEGLHFAKVEGLWVDQRNEMEAERVVTLIERLLASESPLGGPPSVGVVTFNRKQAELIERKLADDAARTEIRALLARDRQRPAVEQLFVRNLENVQGDERDVIIFSTGYGPTRPGGRVHARFGPLGLQGGEKRLNVAVTRARLGVWVISSFDPASLEVSGTKHKGPKLFKLYLQFVKATSEDFQDSIPALLESASTLGGGLGITGAHRLGSGAPRPGHRVRDELAEALAARGYRVQRGLGLGSQRLDLAVGTPGEEGWRVGIDCSEFLASPDPMARDIYTPRFWARLGWRVLRITPSMWLHRPAEVVDRVCQTIEASPPSA